MSFYNAIKFLIIYANVYTLADNGCIVIRCMNSDYMRWLT